MVSKSQLARRIAERGASPAQAAHAVDAVLGEITSALSAGERVTLVGFGTFEPVARPARTGRNPRTGEPVEVPAATVLRFRAGASLRSAVDGGGWTPGTVGSLADKPAGLVVPPDSALPAEPAATSKATTSKASKSKAAKSKASKSKATKSKATKSKATKGAKGTADGSTAKAKKAVKDRKHKGAKGRKSSKKT